MLRGNRGAETSQVFTSILNDRDEPDDIRDPAMFEREDRAADY
jgi:hypothetical protein